MQQHTVVIVEDEFLIRLAIAEAIREAGYKVLEATSGDEGRKLFESGEPIDLLFSDVTMEGQMDGLALAAWVRANFPHVKIVITTGAMGINHPVGLKDYDGFLSKPYLPDDVMTTITNLIGPGAR